jgi:ubiquinone/menaquinone biosynthesis C-methylase UbiE
MESSDRALALPAPAGPIAPRLSPQAADHAAQLRLLERFLSPATTFLELCEDDYSLAVTIADRIKRTYAAVDIAAVPTTGQRLPANFHLALAHRANVPVPSSSIDVAYTTRRLDLLRPTEVLDLLAEIYRALAPHGTFLYMAMHRTTYTIGQLRAMLRKVGFRRVTQYAHWRDAYVPLPSSVLRLLRRAALDIRLAARK